MDGVDLGRGRGASVGDYNSKRKLTHVSRPSLLILVLSRRSNHQDRHIKPRSRHHRPTWVLQISDIRLPQEGIRATPIRNPGMALTYTVLPLRTAANQSKLSCRAPGPLRPIPWVGQALRYMPRAHAPRHPIPVRTGTDPVPRRPFPEHLLPLTAGSPASHTPMLFRGPRMSVVVQS
jgi:hypothetical protein